MTDERRRPCLLYVADKMKVGGAVQKRHEIAGHVIKDSKSIEKLAKTFEYAAKIVCDEEFCKFILKLFEICLDEWEPPNYEKK